MTQQFIKRTALILSTTPPIPRDYGNRNRVYQMVEFLRQAGFLISFILYPHDEDWTISIPSYYHELVRLFDYFTVIPNSIKLHQQAAGFHHEIDEWWDDNIGRHLEWLFKRKRFDVFFVNYTFMSKALEYAPSPTLRILETHDIFSGRREMFGRHGVAPEFFYTNEAREKVAFDRADAVLAIKHSEAKFIAGLAQAQAICIPYWDKGLAKGEPQRETEAPIFSHERPLRLGFIGAQNSVNVVNMQRFLRIFNRYVRFYNLPVAVIVAGNVCRQLLDDFGFLTKLGRIAAIDEFYENIDAVIAPLEFSTGIKIKIGEALAWQMPVLATDNAFDGYKVYHKTQSEASVNELCQSIASLAYNEISFKELRAAARHSARAAARAQDAGLVELGGRIKASMRRIVVVADRPFWYRTTLIDEMLAQTIEFISQVRRTIVIYLCAEIVQSSAIYASVDYIQASNEGTLRAALDDLGNAYQTVGVNLVVEGVMQAKVSQMLGDVGVDAWELSLDRRSGRGGAAFQSCDRDAINAVISVTTLRYRPLMCPEQGLDPKRLAIFTPQRPSDWEQNALDIVAGIAEQMDISVVRYSVSDWYEYEAAFMAATARDMAKHVVFFSPPGETPVFPLQLWHYRNIDPLILNEACPFADPMRHGDDPPSLDTAVRAYLSGLSPGGSVTDSDKGWEQMWSLLS